MRWRKRIELSELSVDFRAMETFSYSAIGASGSTESGTLQAQDRNEAIDKLDRQGLQPLEIKALSGSGMKKSRVVKTKESKTRAEALPQPVAEGAVRLSRSQLVLFTEELSDLLEAGLALEPSLAIMEQREDRSALKEVAAILRQEVRDGNNFSSALGQASPSFGDLYRGLVAAGEASGSLAVILRKQAGYLRKMQALRGQLVTALIYPAFLMCAGVAVGLVFVLYLIPKLTLLIESTGGQAPGIVNVVILFKALLIKYWWLVLAASAVSFAVATRFIKAKKNHLQVDRWKLKMWFTGKMVSTSLQVQFLETLSNLVGNGVTLHKALELTRNATSNAYVKATLSEIIENVGGGMAFSRALKRDDFWPPLMIDMVRVGEETGRLGEALERAAKRFDRELSEKVERISAFIQPVVILMMAVVVGLMAYVMISMIYDTMAALRSRG